MSRLRDRYSKDVAPVLAKEFGYKNVMAIPKIEKVVVNMGLGEATGNAKIVDTGVDEIARLTGQKPVVTRREEVDRAFKVREGMPIGAWSRCAATGCGSSSTASSRRAAACPRLPRRLDARRSTAAATTRSA